MIPSYSFKSSAQVVKAVERWFGLPRYKRAAAIVSQHGLGDASEIFQRDSRGKCYSQYTFIGRYDDVTITFDYWGSIYIGDWLLPEWHSTGDKLRKDVLDCLSCPHSAL